MNPHHSHDKDRNPVKESNLQEDKTINSEQPEHPKMGAKNEFTSTVGMTEETNILTEKSVGVMKAPVDPMDEGSVKADNDSETNDREMLDEVDEFSDEEVVSRKQEMAEDDNSNQLSKVSNKSSL